MLDIIGNIKVDESKPERIRYLVACIRSYLFLKDEANFILNLHTPSPELLQIVKNELFPFRYHHLSLQKENNYGAAYCMAMEKCRYKYILNFMEDQFMLENDLKELEMVLRRADEHHIDIIKSTFYTVEQKSSGTLKLSHHDVFGKYFINDENNFHQYCRHYGYRYYIGVNFITTDRFARLFWSRHLGPRPHDYEIPAYSKDWHHACMIPNVELQCAIDDDHGQPGTCLLKRMEPKWLEIISQVNKEYENFPSVGEKQQAVKESPLKFNDLRAENDFFRNKIQERFDSVMDSGIYLFGDQCRELEKNLAAFVGKRYCLTVKNCTDAITMVVKHILRVHPDATVILPNFGAYPTAIAVKNCTDNIYFADIDDTFTLDPQKLPAHIKNGIVIAVHLFGNNADIKTISAYCKTNDHILIEDCAQSLGSGSGGYGHFSVFSFYPTKPLGTMGDGGAICTNSVGDYEELKQMRFYGFDADGDILHAGINSRMGELECAVVNAKMYQFQELNKKRIAIAQRYKKIVKGIRTNGHCIYHQFPVLFNNRSDIIQKLDQAKILYMIHYPKYVSDLAVFSSLSFGRGTEGEVADKIISIPCHAFMTEDQIQQVEEFLNDVKHFEL